MLNCCWRSATLSSFSILSTKLLQQHNFVLQTYLFGACTIFNNIFLVVLQFLFLQLYSSLLFCSCVIAVRIVVAYVSNCTSFNYYFPINIYDERCSGVLLFRLSLCDCERRKPKWLKCIRNFSTSSQMYRSPSFSSF